MEIPEISSSLPEEMLRMIFSYLPPEDLKAVVLVCKLWSRVGQAPGLWSWVTFHAWNNEAVLEQMRLPRLQKVSRLNITAQNVSEELMEAVAMHPGLKKVETYGQIFRGLKRVETECRWTNLSSVRPELLARTFGKMEDLNLGGTKLTVDQLNCLFASLASGKQSSQKGKLDLSENSSLCEDGIEPSLLAAASVRFKIVSLYNWGGASQQSWSIALFDALGSSFSCVQHLDFGGIDLSAVDTEVLTTAVSKMHFVRLRCVNLTPRQATELFTAIGEDGSKLRVLDLNANDLSSVEPSSFIPPLKFLRELHLISTDLTTQQVEAILDGLGNDSNLTDLSLNCNDISHVDPTKLVKVNHLKIVDLCVTHISIQQLIEILRASISGTNLNEIYWSMEEVLGWFATIPTWNPSLEEFQKLEELMSTPMTVADSMRALKIISQNMIAH